MATAGVVGVRGERPDQQPGNVAGRRRGRGHLRRQRLASVFAVLERHTRPEHSENAQARHGGRHAPSERELIERQPQLAGIGKLEVPGMTPTTVRAKPPTVICGPTTSGYA